MKQIIKIVTEAEKKLHKDHDFVMAICGPEGGGKSHLMLNIIEQVYPKATIKSIGFNTIGFINALKGAKRYGLAVFDEAGDGLYSRDAMTGVNKLLAKAFMTIRGRNLFTILVLPDFFDLDSYFRKHRVKGLFIVPKRGRVRVYNKRQIDRINQIGERTKRILVKPSIYDTFPKYKGYLAEIYKMHKDEKIKESLDNLDQSGTGISKIDLFKALLLKGVEFNEAVKIADISTPYAYKIKNSLDL